MGKCSKCEKKAVFLKPSFCREHFISYFEDKVFSTIKDNKLFSRDSKVCVAASGGKDSLAVLYLVNKFVRPGNCSALLIDEGISGYRKKTLFDLEVFCKRYAIPLQVVSFSHEFGKTLDEFVDLLGEKPCTVCGILRRYLLNKYSKGFDFLATGHNLDDESQAVLMNLFRNQLSVLSRLGPVSGSSNIGLFVQRVKPLYFCPEKEVALYSLLKGFKVSFVECPYVVDAFRADVRDFLNTFDSGAKFNIVKFFLGILPGLKKDCSGLQVCSVCSEPSASKVCNACRLVGMIR